MQDKRMGRLTLMTRFLYILLLSFLPLHTICAKDGNQRYKIAACDWMMLKRQKIGEFQLAKQIGADGIEMDMGGLGNRDTFDNKLHQVYFQKQFRRTADSLGMKVPSVAMSGFFAQSFVAKNNYKVLIEDCLATMRIMGAKVAFLPLGGCGTGWHKDGAERTELVRRLHESGEMAKAENVVIGIRTALDAKEDIRLLDEVKSDGIKIYYNFQDATDNKRDVCKELKMLGKERICQIHSSNTDSVTLDKDKRIDLQKVKKTLDKMGWGGWLVIERSRDVSRVKDVKYNYGTNVRYLKQIFKNGNTIIN